MKTHTLSPEALQIIEKYHNLKLGGKTIPCPYFNNRRVGARGTIAVLVGKGNPKEIEEEALILATKEHIDLTNLSADSLRQFCIDHHLGIDCSGYAFHILEEEVYAQTKKDLKREIRLPFIANPLKRLIAKLQVVKHVGTKTLAHPQNSHLIPLSETKPGDLIIGLEIGTDKDRHHMLVITKIEQDDTKQVFHYTQAFASPSDGVSSHGVKDGTITVLDPSKPLLEAVWQESHTDSTMTETKTELSKAKIFGLYRLHVLA